MLRTFRRKAAHSRWKGSVFMVQETERRDPLGYEKVGKLMRKFAIPSIMALLVNSIYNIIDQIFIGNVVGELGNAATNVAFPLISLCTALSLLFGIGGAAGFNLKMGAGDREKAPYYIGTAITFSLLSGILLLIITEVFMTPLLRAFGAPDTVLPYAIDYTWILALGFPACMIVTTGGHVMRADGRPNLTMTYSIIGAVINVGLDAWFIVGLGWGMQGAALATIIGQYISALLFVFSFRNFKSFKVKFAYFIPRLSLAGRVASLGLGPASNQAAMVVTQIVLNNSLKIYGAQSIYGEEIPIAIAGIIMKVSGIMMSVVIGLGQGQQPIASFNYGAGNCRRVKDIYYRTLICAGIFSVICFIIYQTIPEMLIKAFGDGSELYIEFGVMYFRVFLFATFIFFLQPVTANLFTALGKPWKGMFLSLTRQIIYLIPLMLILPRFMGIDGILYSQPTSDFLAAITSVVMVCIEFSAPEFRREKGVFKGIFVKSKEAAAEEGAA